VTVREISARCSAIAALLRRGRAFPGDEAGGGSLGRADGAEDIGQSGALIVRGRGSRRAHRRVILFFWPIRERSPGSFELRYSLGTDAATGKRRMANVTVRGTRKDAEKELRRLLRSLDTGEHVDPTRITGREWLATWLATVRQEITPKTHEGYAEIVNHFLAPALGNLQLATLAPAHIQSFYNTLAEGGRRDGKPGGLSSRRDGCSRMRGDRALQQRARPLRFSRAQWTHEIRGS